MSANREPLLDFETDGPVHIGTIKFSSVLSAANVAEFGQEVLNYIKAHPKLNLLLSFENVDYLSSAVLTELLRINSAIEESKGTLRLCAISPVIREVFEITNLDSVFTLHADSVEKDLKRFHRAIEIAEQEQAWTDKK